MTTDGLLDLTVTDRRPGADGVVVLELGAATGQQLPDWWPGAHIDLHLPQGMTRQYLLCGRPAERRRWRVAVLREPAGRGGSTYVHDAVAVGDVLTAGGPRNHFPFRPAQRCLFVAGGIGIPPLCP
jgi:ferredoxin-NADP reductase